MHEILDISFSVRNYETKKERKKENETQFKFLSETTANSATRKHNTVHLYSLYYLGQLNIVSRAPIQFRVHLKVFPFFFFLYNESAIRTLYYIEYIYRSCDVLRLLEPIRKDNKIIATNRNC